MKIRRYKCNDNGKIYPEFTIFPHYVNTMKVWRRKEFDTIIAFMFLGWFFSFNITKKKDKKYL